MEGLLGDGFGLEDAGDGGGGGGDDAKLLAGLSTVLVATIQEVKDRISHIEFLFCSQLFPRIQSRSRAIQRGLSTAGARRTSGQEWARKETSLLRQIEELRLEKKRGEEEFLRQIEEFRLVKKREEEESLRQIEELRLGKRHAEDEISRLAASVEREKTEVASQHEAEKTLLLEKLECARRTNETTVAELKDRLESSAVDLKQCKELVGQLLEQNKHTEMELEGEKQKRKQLKCALSRSERSYKNLKSQYCFLLRKVGLTPEPKGEIDSEDFSPISLPNKRKSPQDTKRNEDVDALDIKTDELVVATDDTGRQGASSSSSISGCDTAAVGLSQDLLRGTKMALPSWVDTRARQEARINMDPHDDFLDTPLENIRENLRGVQDYEPHGVPDVPPDIGKNLDDSDGEIKQVNVDPAAQKPQISVLKPEKKSHKFIEPVRKKADRENLKGVECRQCKKFYDAVLPDDRAKDAGGFRCEHHEGVSRHRYRYAPPMTPEGFWNIGFDSDM